MLKGTRVIMGDDAVKFTNTVDTLRGCVHLR